MFILSTVIAGATLGGTIGGAIATITGTGAMPDFDFPKGNLAPWWNYEALGMNAISGTAVGTLIGAGTTAAACTVQGTEAAARQLA